MFQRLASPAGRETGDRRPGWSALRPADRGGHTRPRRCGSSGRTCCELGPAELPTFVWPSGDELAMQAFVLGEEANQDPEEDEED